MRTNNKQARSAIRQHIIDCVYDFDGSQFTTFVDAAKHLNGEYRRETINSIYLVQNNAA